MKIEAAIESMKKSLFWGNWSDAQAEAIRTLILEADLVDMLKEENRELRKQIHAMSTITSE